MEVDSIDPSVLQQLRKLCATLPGAEEYVMVHHPAFRVGKKPFAVLGMRAAESSSVTLSINLGKEAQLSLLDDARFARTPYIGQHGWLTIAYEQLRKGELSMLVVESYRRVANRKQLALLDAETATKSRPAAQRKSLSKASRKRG